MFGSIGGFEMLVLAAIGLLVFGPRRLPEVGRTLAKGMMELRKAANEMRSAIEQEAGLEEIKGAAGELRRTIHRESEDLRATGSELMTTTGGPTTATGGPSPSPGSEATRGEDPRGEAGGPPAA